MEKLSVSPILFETIHLLQLPQRPRQEIVFTHLHELQEYLGILNLKKTQNSLKQQFITTNLSL
jgi:hypothetical protein